MLFIHMAGHIFLYREQNVGCVLGLPSAWRWTSHSFCLQGSLICSFNLPLNKHFEKEWNLCNKQYLFLLKENALKDEDGMLEPQSPRLHAVKEFHFLKKLRWI